MNMCVWFTYVGMLWDNGLYPVTSIIFNKMQTGQCQAGSISGTMASKQEVEAWQQELWEEGSFCLQS